jgi:hypothetical protein
VCWPIYLLDLEQLGVIGGLGGGGNAHGANGKMLKTEMYLVSVRAEFSLWELKVCCHLQMKFDQVFASDSCKL